MSARVRNLRGKFVSQREARVIAAQITTLPVEEPRMPDFAERGPHWHENCMECYGDEDAASTHSVLRRLTEWWESQRMARLLEKHEENVL